MHTERMVSLSTISAWESLSLFLTSLGLPKSRQKKYYNTKSLLLKPIFAREELKISIDLLNLHVVNPSYKGHTVKVLKENNLFLALSKPKRVHSLPLKYSEQDNILSFVRGREKYSEVLKLNKDSYEKGLLFRLDYETSGVIILAKDEKFYINYRDSLPRGKFYLAIAKGETRDDFSYAHCIRYFGKKRSRGRASNEATKNSHLAGKTLAYNEKKDISLVLIKLQEGMRHQIRIQLAAEGHPIIGDSLYGEGGDLRLCLHSFCYQIDHEGDIYDVIDDSLEELEIIFDINGIFKMAHQAFLSF